MKTYFISDTHFGHKNIIRYCNRPFNDVEEMNNIMINEWNSIIQPDDIVYHLGDFCLGDRDVIKKYLARLSGRKMIVLGNHDKYRPTEYMELGFEWSSRFPIIFNQFMILSHEPVFLEANSPYCNLYGHLHQNKYESPNGNHLCVCVEQIDYKPISLDDVSDIFYERGIKSEK